jgi:deoxyribodipyrimidine photo-lyase
MWFASIWVFTLRLPWELGADFFLRHLLDGDPASNTLSWRWVAGLQTAGKTYLARADNIAQFTGGRFRPEGLAKEATVPRAEPTPAPCPIERAQPFDPARRTVFLLHEDDLSPGFLFDLGLSPVATALLAHPEGRSPLVVSDRVIGFSRGAVEDAARRWSARLGEVRGLEGDPAPDALADWVAALRAEQVVSAHAPVGPVARRLSALEAALAARGIPLIRQMRDEDAAAWPHATHGFFRFWEAMRP